uniref:Transmembrane protein 269 n=1 Tax=Chrysemys picta bellii TaxID=8478 RepID=A0A8C3FJ97_CHRPI
RGCLGPVQGAASPPSPGGPGRHFLWNFPGDGGGGAGIKATAGPPGAAAGARATSECGAPRPWQYHCACWLLLIGFLLDLADGAVARQLNACSALGAKLDDFADFTSFGLATALLLQAHGILDGLLAIVYVLAVFSRLCFFSSGIPFMYRGLPCPYASSLLTGTYLLTGGNLVVLRIVAMIMILFMVDQGFYPHDKVLESQLWKKMVYAGGILMVLFSSYSIVSLYYLVWSSTYIFFPVALWSCKV